MAQTPTPSPLRAIAQSILAHLVPLAASPTSRVRSVRMLDRVRRPEDLFSGRTPSLTVTYAGTPKFVPMSMGHSRVASHARWVVLLAVGSLASDAARLEGTTGDNGEAGLFELIDLVRATLQARVAGDRTLSLVAIDNVANSATCTIWGFRIETVDEETADEAAVTRQELLAIDGSLSLADAPEAPPTDVHVPTP